MVISLIHPHTCGFAKVAAWSAAKLSMEVKRNAMESDKHYEGRKVRHSFEKFVEHFEGNPKFSVDFTRFKEKLPELRRKFIKWSPRKIHEREEYLDCFSCENWQQIGAERKAEHSLMDCQACSHRYVEQSFFPVSSTQFFGCQQDNPLFVAENIQDVVAETPPVKSTKKDAARYAEAVYDTVFEKTVNMPFKLALTKVKKLELETRKSKADKKEERRDHYRKSRASLKDQWKKTDVMRYKFQITCFLGHNCNCKFEGKQ